MQAADFLFIKFPAKIWSAATYLKYAVGNRDTRNLVESRNSENVMESLFLLGKIRLIIFFFLLICIASIRYLEEADFCLSNNYILFSSTSAHFNNYKYRHILSSHKLKIEFYSPINLIEQVLG